MDPIIFFTTFGIIFLAELGDKTQLMAMTLAMKYPWKKIFIGIAGAFIVLNIGAVFLGKLLVENIPEFWIKLCSGFLFLFFGISTLRSKSESDEKEKENNSENPALTAFFLMITAELGDKTQLVTCSLAAQYKLPLTVFCGSTLALILVSLLGILLGKQITRVFPLSTVQKLAGCGFLLFAALTFYSIIPGL